MKGFLAIISAFLGRGAESTPIIQGLERDAVTVDARAEASNNIGLENGAVSVNVSNLGITVLAILLVLQQPDPNGNLRLVIRCIMPVILLALPPLMYFFYAAAASSAPARPQAPRTGATAATIASPARPGAGGAHANVAGGGRQTGPRERGRTGMPPERGPVSRRSCERTHAAAASPAPERDPGSGAASERTCDSGAAPASPWSEICEKLETDVFLTGLVLRLLAKALWEKWKPQAARRDPEAARRDPEAARRDPDPELNVLQARALEQLIDMFPQYDRRDLLGELRYRGSIEAVTESILMGIFWAVPRS
ncbi:unnamed protein product [Pseudo-nitzschia multistriata]|uniref:CUE domain-containing protein n=1 Tax=Pseudo-nitzschia multistriata TaxID=183589 RepID=A0A448ZSP8_9STRA|nr:unnamed protein product [Pseudo-nitzschia multistriata]